MDNTTNQTDFAKRVKYLSDEVFGSQLALAKAIGVNNITIKRWIEGENNPNKSYNSTIIDNLKIYNINPNWFYMGDGEVFIDPEKNIVVSDTQGAVAERLNEVRHFFKIKTWLAMAKEFGLKETTLHAYKNGRLNLPDDFLDKLSDRGISRDWLLNGTGFMLKEQNGRDLPTNDLMNEKPSKLIPFFSSDITASIVHSFDDILMSPAYYIRCSFLNDCDACFPVYGDSMYPKYCSGDVVGVRNHNRDFILWGESYLVITNSEGGNLRTIKMIFKHEDPSKVILRASNPNFAGDTVIPIESIISLHLVKGKIHINSF